MDGMRSESPSLSDPAEATPIEDPESGASSQDSVSPQAFTCFPNLPVELRYVIWKYAAKFPRLIPISALEQMLRVEHDGGQSTKGALVMSLFGSDCPQPAVLQACRESRKECLDLFQIVGGTQLAIFRPNIGIAGRRNELFHEPRIYFNPAVDMIFARCSSGPTLRNLLNALGKGFSWPSMKSIAIPAHWFSNDTATQLPLLFIHLVLRTNIEEIIVILEHDSKNKLSSIKGVLEPVELNGKELCYDWILEHSELALVSRLFRRAKRDSLLLVRPQAVVETHQLSGPEIWAGGLMVSDGKCRHFDQKAEDLITPEVEEFFKCPKIKIMGVAKGGVRN